MITLYRDKENIRKNLPNIFYGVGREHYERILHEFVLEHRQKPGRKYWTEDNLKNSTQVWGRAKRSLLKESYKKCGYCERKVARIGYNCEHYRPKSKYYWLAYSYLNYIPSCSECNEEKFDRFEIDGNKVPLPMDFETMTLEDVNEKAGHFSEEPLFDTSKRWRYSKYVQKRHKREKPRLLNPYLDQPEKVLGYHCSDINQEVCIVSRAFWHSHRIKVEETTKESVRLNRPELVKDRYRALLEFREAWFDAKSIPDRNKRKKELKRLEEEFTRPNKEYSGMFRFYTKRKRRIIPLPK